MSTLGKDSVSITHFIRNLRGGSQPILAQASDGHTYVVKFANNLQGPNLLFNESVGSELYRACGLPVPAWRPVLVSDSFLDKHPDCWMQTPGGRLRPTSGLCFGSRYLGESDKRLLEILPNSSFMRVRNQGSFWLAWLIDVCAEHVDNRHAIFVQSADGWLDPYFVDHGHLFSGPNSDMRKNFRASRYLDTRIYGEVTSEALLHFKNAALTLNTDAFWQRLGAIPAEWRRPSALVGFERCLQRLADPLLVQSVLDTIKEAHQGKANSEPAFLRCERKSPLETLRLAVQNAGFGQNQPFSSACA
jgi:hypothetical protein